MSVAIQAKLRELSATLETLEESLSNAAESLTAVRDEKEKLIQDHWRQRKELTTSQHAAREVAALREDNEALRAERAMIMERLQKLLGQVKALGEELRQ